MPLCEVCNAINFHSLLQEAEQAWKSPSTKRKKPLKLHDTIERLAHRDKCDLCGLIWFASLTALGANRTRKHFQKPSVSIEISCRKPTTQPDSERASLELRVNERTPYHADWYPLEIYTRRWERESGTPAVKFLDRYALKETFRNSGSQQAVDLACQWYKRCLSDHASCRRETELDFELPTRLIEVGDEMRNPFLYISSQHGSGDPRGAWVALSYCWGGDSSFVLTAESLSSLMAGIPLNDFPKTLQDAICITKALGVRYLWIDALCILQDSITDWEQESPKMSSIYSNAVLTIIAATAPSVTTGIFQERQDVRSCQLPLREPRPVDTNSSDNEAASKDEEVSFGVRMVPTKLPGQILTRWGERGWTYQEQLLSWRTLQYHPTQMVWSCIKSTVLENGITIPEGNSQPASEQREFQLYRTKLETRLEQDLTTPYDIDQKYRMWYEIVSNYSGRDLTRESDRLPGIGGLALSIAESINDTYHAGLWEKDMIYGLAWQIDTREYHEEKSHAPGNSLSWNWTSSRRRVRFPVQRGYEYTEFARVVDIDIKYSSSIYGIAQSGRLVLSGPCYHASLVDQEIRATSALLQMPKFLKYLNVMLGDMMLSRRAEQTHSLHGPEYVVLKLLFGQESTKWEIQGKMTAFLVLECLDASLLCAGARSYRRFEMVLLEHNRSTRFDVLDELERNPWPEETITIL